MERRLSLLQEKLDALGRKSTLVFYRHFDANLLGLHFTGLLPFPMFLLFAYYPTLSRWDLAVYEPVSEKYDILICNTLISPANNYLYERLVCTDILQVVGSHASGLDFQGIMEEVKNFGNK
jgi:hypothetical protein